MIKKILSIVSIAILLVGCAGKMDGMIRDSGKRVIVKYEQGMSSDMLHVTMPSGEHFKGKVVMVGATTGFGYTSGSANVNYSGGGYATATGSSFSTMNTTTDNMQGVLFGNKGHSMRCNFQYADTTGFTTAGGVGVCQTSNGKTIDIQW